MQQMVADDAVLEALETDNLALQTMSGGKYVQVPLALAHQDLAVLFREFVRHLLATHQL